MQAFSTRRPRRTIGNLLFLGPTGSGKMRIVEAAAEILFGDCRPLSRQMAPFFTAINTRIQ